MGKEDRENSEDRYNCNKFEYTKLYWDTIKDIISIKIWLEPNLNLKKVIPQENIKIEGASFFKTEDESWIDPYNRKNKNKILFSDNWIPIVRFSEKVKNNMDINKLLQKLYNKYSIIQNNYRPELWEGLDINEGWELLQGYTGKTTIEKSYIPNNLVVDKITIEALLIGLSSFYDYATWDIYPRISEGYNNDEVYIYSAMWHGEISLYMNFRDRCITSYDRYNNIDSSFDYESKEEFMKKIFKSLGLMIMENEIYDEVYDINNSGIPTKYQEKVKNHIIKELLSKLLKE